MKNQAIPDTVSDILRAEKEYNYNLSSLIVDELHKKGIDVTKRAIQKYIKGDLVPDYLMAKEIFRILKLNYSESDMLDLISRSKEKLIAQKEQSLSKVINPDEVEYSPAFLKKRISIAASDFSFIQDESVSSEYAVDLIEQRVQEEYGNSKYSFNRYIKDLIDQDMKNYEKFSR